MARRRTMRAAIVPAFSSTSLPPSRMFPPRPSMIFCSGRMSITAFWWCLSNSLLCASLSPQTLRAYSITAIWKPRHRPR